MATIDGTDPAIARLQESEARLSMQLNETAQREEELRASLAQRDADIAKAVEDERKRIVAIIRKIAGRIERGSASHNNHLALALALEEKRAG